MSDNYWRIVRVQFFKRKLAVVAFCVVILFCLVGIYAPFLASSKPLIVEYEGQWYFPLFRYLFYQGFYTKKIDIFFNVLIFTFPFIAYGLFRGKKRLTAAALLVQLVLFLYFSYRTPYDPASDPALNSARQQAMEKLQGPPSWDFQLQFMNPYEKLNLLLRYRTLQLQNERIEADQEEYLAAAQKRWLQIQAREKRLALLRSGKTPPSMEALSEQILKETPEKELAEQLAIPTLWNMQQQRVQKEILHLEQLPNDPQAKVRLEQVLAKKQWFETESQNLHFVVMPLLRSFHWEDDAGGHQTLNKYVSWWELTRINRKDMVAALIFGVRISLVVGLVSVALALLIGIPIGAVAGYYGGRTDMVVSRLLEIWESMPVFFMLLLVVAMTQSKSIFIIICVIGLFGWTTFSRYIRGEFFKQRSLPYVEACFAGGFGDRYIIFSHIMPNAIPPLLTLLPFAVMSAITSEAALSFLGLGEEGSASWGVLMDEGRSAFPGESYLLWPPAILLTILLIAIALVGDALRDALDPKLHR